MYHILSMGKAQPNPTHLSRFPQSVSPLLHPRPTEEIRSTSRELKRRSSPPTIFLIPTLFGRAKEQHRVLLFSRVKIRNPPRPPLTRHHLLFASPCGIVSMVSAKGRNPLWSPIFTAAQKFHRFQETTAFPLVFHPFHKTSKRFSEFPRSLYS